jgi:hypothetical protein
MMPLAEQLLALGLDGSPVIAESAELDGDRVSPAKTLARLRVRLDYYERELEGMYAFAAKWKAPMEEVTDRDGEYREAAARLRAGIALLEAHIAARGGA